MTVLLRTSACALILFGAVLLVGCVLIPWMGGPSLFAADLGEMCQSLWKEHARSEALTARDSVVSRRLIAKAGVTREVVAGRLSLAEAVNRFDELHEPIGDEHDEILGASYCIGKDRQSLARNVILWASTALHGDPRSEEILARLEKELAELSHPGLH